jgi:uncharacterized protein YcbK (DUF882 family)
VALTWEAAPKTLKAMLRALVASLVVGLSGAVAHAKPRKLKAPPPPAAELYAINTHETFMLRPDAHGRIGKAQLRGWNRFLRCHHTGRVHFMSTRLAQLIYQVDQHFEFKKIVVVAGYRAPRVAREKGNPKSPHKKGVACDFRVEGIANTELRDFERTLPRVGVGYYPNSDFVHLDVDPSRLKHNAFWIDYSGPGERARYSKDVKGDLEAEKTAEEGADEAESVQEQEGGGDPHLPVAPGATAPYVPAGVTPIIRNP